MAEIDPDEKEKMLGELETRGKLRGFREGRIQGSLKMLWRSWPMACSPLKRLWSGRKNGSRRTTIRTARKVRKESGWA